jgi:hypothetical protein
MQVTFRLIILLWLSATGLFGQKTNTEKLFRNLPLDKSALDLNNILHNDSTNYKQYIDKTGAPYYIAATKVDTFFYLVLLI